MAPTQRWPQEGEWRRLRLVDWDCSLCWCRCPPPRMGTTFDPLVPEAKDAPLTLRLPRCARKAGSGGFRRQMGERCSSIGRTSTMADVWSSA
jgi:hypothetical protein